MEIVWLAFSHKTKILIFLHFNFSQFSRCVRVVLYSAVCPKGGVIPKGGQKGPKT